MKVRTLDSRPLDTLQTLDRLNLDSFNNLDGIGGDGGVLPSINNELFDEGGGGDSGQVLFNEGIGGSSGLVLINEGDVSLLNLIPGARYAYSTRKLKSNYPGFCMRVRNSIGELLDIGFDENGNLDTVALEIHANGNLATLETWYDQSDNGNDISAAILAEQPLITDNSGIVLVMPGGNGRPSPRDDSESSELRSSLNHGAITDFSVFSVFNQVGIAIGGFPRVCGAQESIELSFRLQQEGSQDNIQLALSNRNIVGGTILNILTQVSGFAKIKTGTPDGELSLFQDGLHLISEANNQTTPASIASPFCLFNNASATNHWNGFIGEVVYYENLKLESRTIVESNQRIYWGTP